MNKAFFRLLICLPLGHVDAGELRVSSKEPIVVTAPGQWTSTRDKSQGNAFPIETYQIAPAVGRNAVCLISIYDKDKQTFADPQFLKTLLRAESRPYVNSPNDLPKIELKEVKIHGGLGFYADFVDPDLVGKPVKEGSYKTATPMILSLGSAYLIKVTVLCDEINGADYRDAVKIVESIGIKNEALSIPIPKQGWSISVDAPALTRGQGQEEGPNYIYRANSGRFNLSIFVEPQAKAGGSKACYEYYWPQANRNPLISQPTVKVSNSDKFYRVQYDVVVGPHATQKNVNYYFMFEGKWVDVHISIMNPVKEDDALIASFDKGLRYGK